jgi:asparagine synthase (glutamine-hydrolysing)
MCGIIGSLNIKWSSNPLKTITHRGPDFNSFFDNGYVYLGHSRLSILDVSSLGNQPMISSDKNWVIVFNGEIYNHLDIRKNLELIFFLLLQLF